MRGSIVEGGTPEMVRELDVKWNKQKTNKKPKQRDKKQTKENRTKIVAAIKLLN